MSEPKLSIEDFIGHAEVKKCLADLELFIGNRPLVLSDVIDEEGSQYVHLVQKGGGVLGVALVGYTYILEQMGVRFLKQAGTSAGAINTALMTVIGNKQDAKSANVLQAICDLEFFSLVDGHPVARWLIKRFLTDGKFMKKTRSWIIGIAGTLLFLVFSDIVLLGLQHKFDFLAFWTGLSFVLTGILTLFLFIAAVYFLTLLKRLKNAGYGINPGDYFYDWIKDQFIKNGVRTVSDLMIKASAPVPGLKLRTPDHPEGLKDLEGSVSFITSELSNKNKIQFPQMCDLFRKKEDIDKLQPAGFVRASMSIPIFFESYIINDIPCNEKEIKEAWVRWFNDDDPPSCARFVDGGILSNFPLSLFYNPNIIIPRLPVFGIDLDDSGTGDKGKNAQNWSLQGYFSRIFSTIQNHSDKEFLIRNKVYGKGVGRINVAGYDWLNFFMKNSDKQALFVAGAQAAVDFLKNFKWEEYKAERAEMLKNQPPKIHGSAVAPPEMP